MTLKTYFKKVRKLVQKGWIQGVYKSDYKHGVSPMVRLPVPCFCLGGAMREVACEELKMPRTRFWRITDGNTDWYTVLQWNDQDERTQKQVLDLLDRVIKSC